MDKKMHDMAEPASSQPVAVDEKKRKFYPTLHLEAKQLPGLEDCDVGDEVMLHLKAKVRSKDETEQVGRPLRCSLSLEIKEGMLEK